MDKKSFLFYMNWKNQIELLDDQELRRFINNLIKYHSDEEIELKTKVDNLVWQGILPALEINREKYKKKVESNRDNGKLGGAPKGNQNDRKYETTQNNPNNLINNNSKMKNDKIKLEEEKGEMMIDNKEVAKEDPVRKNISVSNSRNYGGISMAEYCRNKNGIK